MNLKIYTDLTDKGFFMPPYYLKEEGKLKDVELIGSRPLYYAYMKLRGKNTYPFFKSLFAPLKLLFTKDPVILAFAPYRGLIYYLILLKLFRKNIIYHTSWPYWDGSKYVHRGGYIREFLWRKFLKGTKVICINKKACEGVNRLGARGVRIPHPIDFKIFEKKSKENKKLNVLFVGRLIEEKGVLDILKLAVKFKDVKFTFVGRGELSREIEKSRLDNVEYMGFVKDKSELSKIYREADIFISNSYATKKWEELFGMVIIEAMASGLAIISTDCVGPKEIIEDGDNGFLIKQKDYVALDRKLEELINNKALRKRFGDNARKKAEREYDINVISDKWLKLLKS